MKKGKRLVYSVGVNDADYVVIPTVDGKRVHCEYYKAWKGMLERCYSEKYQAEYTTYKGCSVCDDWLVFSKFKKWMMGQNWEGKALDKDIIDPENKVYSPEKCAFVTSDINNLITDRRKLRGKYKQGVVIKKTTGKFLSSLSVNSKTHHIGYYDTENEAHAAYVEFKAAHIREVADTQEPRVKAGLYRHAAALEATLEKCPNTIDFLEQDND